MKRTIFTFLSLITSVLLHSQGYFYTESTVQINGGASIEVKGDAVIHQPIDGDGFFVMNGDNVQDLSGNSVNMNNLRVSNGADVMLEDDVWVNDTLDMASGILYTLENNIYLGDGSYHSGNLNGFVQTDGTGYIERMLDASAFTFHVGNGSEYFPITLTETGTPDTFHVQGWNYLPDDGTVSGNPINTHVALLSFSVNDNNIGGNNLSVSIQWNDTKNAVDFAQSYAIGIWYNGGNYIEMDDCPTNVSSIDPNIVSYVGILNVGTFSIGDSMYLSNIPTAYINPGDTTVCLGTNVTFTAMPSGAAGYNWSTAETTQVINTSTAGNYWVEVTDASGCTYQSDVVTLDTLSVPVTPNILQSGNDLSVAAMYTSYQWYLDGNPIGGATNPNYTMTANGTYSVIVTNSNGCTSTDVFVFGSFGLEDSDAPALQVSKINDQLYIHYDINEINLLIIYDAEGKVVYQQKPNSNYIGLQLANGIYLIQARMEQKILNQKVVW